MKQSTRWILHVDGDAFFASCEVASRPWLRGRPVITGRERGIATAVSYEAKARGVKRGMRPSDARRVCPEITVIESDYFTYRIYASRMYAIVRRYAGAVEEYSIDECFADVTDALLSGEFVGRPHELGARVKGDLEKELGITFSVGISVSKVVAKIASKWSKPSGLTIITSADLPKYLSELPIHKVWGIGPSTSFALRNMGIKSALDLASRERRWICLNLSKPVREIYEELRGNSVYAVGALPKRDYRTISRTGTFSPPSSDKGYIFAELSRHVEDACLKLRGLGLRAQRISYFVKTQSFEYCFREDTLETPTDMPQEILSVIRRRFDGLFEPGLPFGVKYRATGVRLSMITRLETDTESMFESLFGTSTGAGEKENGRSRRARRDVLRSVDRLTNKFGSKAVFLGSSLRAKSISKSEYGKRFNLPFLGKTD